MDVISDMLIRIKNAQTVKKDSVEVPYSKLKMEIAKILQTNGFIKDATRRGKKTKKIIDVILAYDSNKEGKITDVRRVSKLSKRVYQPVATIKPVMHGKGIAVLSTSKGLMTDQEARKNNVGGEVLFKIW